eukprot:6248210-Ditylum_brightwellii.AAC.1
MAHDGLDMQLVPEKKNLKRVHPCTPVTDVTTHHKADGLIKLYPEHKQIINGLLRSSVPINNFHQVILDITKVKQPNNHDE